MRLLLLSGQRLPQEDQQSALFVTTEPQRSSPHYFNAMPLIQSPSSLAASRIVDLVLSTRSHYIAASGLLNAVTAEILALPNDDLAAFGNALGPLEMQTLTTAHADQGNALNALLAGVNGILLQSGILPQESAVDTRPLADKLAEQNREIVLSDGIFSVIPLTEPPPESF